MSATPVTNLTPGRLSIYDRRLAISGGVLHHIGLLLAAEEHRCAWCEPEGLRLPARPGAQESHGICPRHLQEQKAELEKLAAAPERLAA